MQEMESFNHNGCKVRIMRDEDPENPRGWDNATVFVCFHGRYNLGDKGHGYRSGDYSGWAGLRAAIERDHKPAAILPLGLYDHSGITMYIGGRAECDSAGWDSGQVGFAFVPRETALREWGKEGGRLTKRIREQAEKCIRAEVETYDQFLTGEVYGYEIEGPDGEFIDSCWGFFGLDYCRQEARAAVPNPPTWDDIISGPEIPTAKPAAEVQP